MPLSLYNHCNFGAACSSEAFLRQRSEAAVLGGSLPVALCDAYLSEVSLGGGSSRNAERIGIALDSRDLC